MRRAADPTMSIQDEITEAVLAREDVARYLQGDPDAKGPSARERVEMYLDSVHGRAVSKGIRPRRQQP